MHRMAYGYRIFVCSNMAFAGEFTPVFVKHSRSFSLIDSLAIGVDRMQRSLGRCKKGRRGSMREKGIDGRHRRGGELPVGRPIGNYSIREHKRGSQYRSGETSSKPTSGPEQLPGSPSSGHNPERRGQSPAQRRPFDV
jgi:hypothetical protein